MKTIITRSFALTLLVLISLFAHAEDVIFIVNEKNPITQLSKGQIVNFYFKRIREWPDGNPVRFFDRTDVSPERKAFLNLYLKKSSRDLEEFWIGQKLYTGNSAPSQVANDNMVKSLVLRFPGAIGYVGPDFPIVEGIKKIEINGND